MTRLMPLWDTKLNPQEESIMAVMDPSTLLRRVVKKIDYPDANLPWHNNPDYKKVHFPWE